MDRLNSEFQLLKDVLEYLDISGNLDRVKQTCEKYSTCKLGQDIQVYLFRILINPTELIELSVPLGNSILISSPEVTELFQKVVYTTVKELDLLPETVTLSQISVHLRLTSLPALSNWNKIVTYKDIVSHSHCAGFISFSGVVVGVTARAQYTQSTRYICPNEMCEGHSGNHFVRVHRPGASESQTIRRDFTCTFCGCTLEEVKSCRTLSDKMVADMVPESCFMSESRDGWREQAIPVYVRDDLCGLVELGQAYEVIGLIRKDTQNDCIITAIEANNMEQVSETVSSSVPHVIGKLHGEIIGTSWRLPLTLAYFFGAGIIPSGSYIKMKLAILLSLANCEQEAPIHVIGIGKDVNVLHRLLTYGQRFSDRVCVHTSRKHLTAKVTTDRYNSSPYYIEGGSAFLAYGGICYLGDVSKYKKKTKDKLQSVMTSGKIVTDVSSKFTGGLSQVLETPVRCQMWAYAESILNKKPQHSDELFVGCDTGDIEKTLLDAFSIVQFNDSCDTKTNEDVAALLASQVLYMAIGSQNECHKATISEEDFIKYLQYIRRIHPIMTAEAKALLHGYYVTSRRIRSNQSNSCNVPTTALSSLLSLSVSYARLRMSKSVQEQDALSAIKLYEESLVSRYGCSMISVLPLAHIPVKTTADIFKYENEETMNQLHVQLLKFCSKEPTIEE